MINKGLFSSNKDDWETPQYLFNILDQEFNFNIDVCASKENTKCSKYYTINDNCLIKKWKGNVFMNPPYGKKIKFFVKKAFESIENCNVIVMLLPARTDTKWFHDYIYGKSEIRFIKGRLHFNNSKNSAPFPSMIVIFRGSDHV